MALPIRKFEVDGEKYSLKPLGSWDQMYFFADAFDLAGPALATIATGGGLQAIMSMAVAEIADRLDADKMIRLVKRMVLGRMSTPFGGEAPLDVDDEGTYEQVMDARCAKHGPFHQLKFIQKCVEVNLGPIFAGGHTSPPASE